MCVGVCTGVCVLGAGGLIALYTYFSFPGFSPLPLPPVRPDGFTPQASSGLCLSCLLFFVFFIIDTQHPYLSCMWVSVLCHLCSFSNFIYMFFSPAISRDSQFQNGENKKNSLFINLRQRMYLFFALCSYCLLILRHHYHDSDKQQT